MTNKKRKAYKKKRYIFPILILILLVAARIYLPYWVKDKINETLADIPGFYGEVSDVDMALYRGAYVIEGMYLNKVDAGSQVPFLNFPKTDISIQWRPLFKGEIVAGILMINPEVIYVYEDQQSVPEGGEAEIEDWTKALTEIIPLEINEFKVHDGKFAFVQLETDPDIDIQVAKVELTASNLRNVIEKERVLPSPINATGVSFGGGAVSLDGEMNIIKEIPDMNLNFALENANATALNPFTRHYAGIDFEDGDFGLYSEIAIADGYFKGYVKPLLKDSKLIGKDDGFLGVLWEGFVGFFKFVLKNQGTDTLATRVPLEGDLNSVEAGILPSVINIFKNGWIHAFKGETDNSIEYKDAFKDTPTKWESLTKEQKDKLSSEEKNTLRKASREQNRAERKAKKENDTTPGLLKRIFDGKEDESNDDN